MKINVTGKHIDVGESLQTYVIDEVEKTVDKFYGEGMDSHVIYSPKPHNQFGTEILINIGHGVRLRSNAEAGDPYVSTDMAIEKIVTQLKKYKDRLKAHHHSQADRYDRALEAMQYTLPNEESETTNKANGYESENGEPMVIAEEMTKIPHITVKDAAMRLDLEDLNVMLFVNDATDEFNVIYRRPDGHLGWLEPKK